MFVGLDGEKPSSCVVLRFELPHVTEVNNLIVNPGFPLEVFRFSKLLAATPLRGVTLLWDFFLPPAPATFPQVAIQRSSMFLVLLSTPFGNSPRVLLESSITSSRHNDRCTHRKAVKMCISCCSQFSVVTKQNDTAAAAAANFCASCVSVQCS